MLKKNLRFGKKNLSSSKTGESVGNAKQTFFIFGLRENNKNILN